MKIIGIVGKARSGKSTVADYLVKKYGWEAMYCSAILKTLIVNALKETPPPWNAVGSSKAPQDCIHNNRTPFTRWLLQFIGTDICRALNERMWIEPLVNQLAIYRLTNPYGKIVIPDIRFPNEVEMVRTFGGKIIRIIRKSKDETIEHGGDHSSEKTEELMHDYTLSPEEGAEAIHNVVNDVIRYLEA